MAAPDIHTNARITLFHNGDCHKAIAYAEALRQRGLDFAMRDVDQDEDAREALAALYKDDVAKAPALLIGETLHRNPPLDDLDKLLARAGLYDPGLIHDETQQRYIRHMAPEDAFASYVWRDETMVLTHIQTPASKRGTGLGGRFAAEIFDAVMQRDHPARLTCPFLRKVAASKPEWAAHFLD